MHTLNTIETKPVRNEPYIIIFSTTCLAHQLKTTDVWLDDEQMMGKFYHYRPPHQSSEAKASFHHEAQPAVESSLCGLHALNAYIGFHHLSPQMLEEYVFPSFHP